MSTNTLIRLGLGYGLSKESKLKYERLVEQEARDIRAVEKVNQLIEWAHVAYEQAKVRHAEDIQLYTDLILNWSPERVFSTYRHFEKLCRYFQNERAWKKLPREARKFLTAAYNQYVPPRTIGLVRK